MLIKHAEMDLTAPGRAIYVDERYRRVEILVRWAHLPLGRIVVPCHPGTRVLEAESLRRQALDRFGWEVWERALVDRLGAPPPAAGRLPGISVVVCTRDRPRSLERCLSALKRLDYPAPAYEVLVVDNASHDRTVAEVVTRSGFRYVREDRPGLDWARNRGWQEARHGIVAYIDDDAQASPGWLRGVARGFADADVMAVTGMVLPAEIETEAQNQFEAYGGMSKGCIAYTIRRDELEGPARFRSSNWGVGANMAFRRGLFDTIGGFDVALDVGTPTRGAGDLEFFYRTVAAGFALRYEPSAFVRHVHRRDPAALRRQIAANGRSYVAYLLTIARLDRRHRAAVAWFGVRWWLVDWLVRRVLSSAIRRDRWTFRFAAAELLGALGGVPAYLKSRREARRLMMAGDPVQPWRREAA